MIFARTMAAALCIGFVCSTAAQGQSLRNAQTPAEQPPAGFQGEQYVDSRGCIFVRVDVNGRTNWIPRLTRNRQQICGQPPSDVAAAIEEPVVEAPAAPQTAAAAPAAPAPRRTQAPVAAPRRAEKPMPVTVVAAPKPQPQPKPVPVAAPVVRKVDGKPVPSTSLPGSTRVVPLHVAQARARNGNFKVPKGYRAAWQDDRLNPHRAEGTLAGRDQMNLIWTTTVPRRLIDQSNGKDVTAKVALVYPYTDLDLQRQAIGDVVISSRNGVVTKTVKRKPAKAVISTRSKAETLSGKIYIQAGRYDQKRAAQSEASKLKKLGLPVRIGTYSKNGQTMRLVLAGPFADNSAARGALRSVQKAGFADAFVRK